MATSTDQHGVLKTLKEEVTCPLCLDIFKDPKRLPCDHVYCRGCLHGLIRSSTKRISCPECRTSIKITNRDVSTFPTSYQVNRLIEMYHRSLKSATIQDKVATQPEANCKDHNSQPLALYCDTCQSLVCRDCVITSCSKKNHDYGFIDEMAEKHQRALGQELEPIRELHHQMSSALKGVIASERELQQRKKEEIQKIKATFNSLSEILAQESRYCTEAVEKSFQEQSDLNCAKESELSDIVKELESMVRLVEKSSQNEPKLTILSSSAGKKQSIDKLKKRAREITPQAEVLPEIKTHLPSPKNLKEFCHEKNYYTYGNDPSKAHVDYSVIERFKNVPINKPFGFTLHIDPTNIQRFFWGNTLDSTLCCSHTDFSQRVTAEQVTPVRYFLVFVPQRRGNHKLHIKYNDTHICGSPIPIYVTIEPEEIMKVSKPSVVKTMKGISSVKYCEGKICFAQVESAIYTFNTSMKTIIRTIKIPGVNEFLIDQDCILATDINQHRLLKMNINGDITKAVGKQGYKRRQFNFPNGIRLSRDGKVYVCDTVNNRIQVFDKDLNILTVLGSKEIGKCCFFSPDDLDFDKHGNLYVADQGNCRVQVLTPQGQHIRNIGKKGSGPGELDNPVSVAIHRDMVYVTDLNNKRISVFKTTGEFVRTFGESILVRPETIAIAGPYLGGGQGGQSPPLGSQQ